MTLYRTYLLTKDHSYYDDSSVVLLQTKPNDLDGYYHCKNLLHSLSGERCENVVQLDWPKPFPYDDNPNQEDRTRFEILGLVSINGTLCLKRELHGEKQLALWNPTSREFKFIPFSPIESKPYWFILPDKYQVRVGYDRVTHDYKLIRLISYIPSLGLPSVSFGRCIYQIVTLGGQLMLICFVLMTM